ncbi:MAG: ribonuclease III [Pseudomonadota bacterium]|nr:ribonuclease III [Pseudomonadota bacterium]
MNKLNKLEKILGYRFKDPSLLDLALTHRSVSKQKNNERLEFLGDSIVNHIIAADLVLRFPEATEGQLTRLRSNLVKGDTLAIIAHKFSLKDFIKVGPGELKSGGFRRDSILADAVEAIIAAIYNESGMERCRAIVLVWFEDLLAKQNPKAITKDPKTRLQELMQSLGETLPSYELVGTSGPPHKPNFTIKASIRDGAIEAVAEGKSRRKAEQTAAADILNSLQNEASS